MLLLLLLLLGLLCVLLCARTLLIWIQWIKTDTRNSCALIADHARTATDSARSQQLPLDPQNCNTRPRWRCIFIRLLIFALTVPALPSAPVVAPSTL
jgi:hypothetical protein